MVGRVVAVVVACVVAVVVACVVAVVAGEPEALDTEVFATEVSAAAGFGAAPTPLAARDGPPPVIVAVGGVTAA